MKIRSIIIFLFMIGVTSCQTFDVWNWGAPENTYSDIVFPCEGVLALVSSTDSRITANLRLSVNYDYSGTPAWGEIVGVEIQFDLVDVPCKVTKSKTHLSANILPGTVRLLKGYYGYDQTPSVRISGTYSFDVKLDRFASVYSWDSHLCAGDRLRGNWVIRFESEKGEQLYFKITDVTVQNAYVH